MFIVFNKEYRKFESVMTDFLNKMKKSKNVVQKYEINAEVYELDTVDIIFEVNKMNMVYVMDKNGAQIISLDCHYDFYDKLQYAKWNLFCSFLNKMRNAYNQKIAQAKKLEENAEKAEQFAFSQMIKDKLLNDAFEKLRSL